MKPSYLYNGNPYTGKTASSYHYSDVIMSVMASQITSLIIVYSTVYLGTDQRKDQSSASLAFVRGIHWWPVNSPHKGQVTWKMFPLDDIIMSRCPSWFLHCFVLFWLARYWVMLPISYRTMLQALGQSNGCINARPASLKVSVNILHKSAEIDNFTEQKYITWDMYRN